MDTDDRDPPIEPLDYLHGFTVVDFGDVRVARGMTRRARSVCPHLRLVYDQQERRVWCRDCEHNVEAFDAFLMLAERSCHQWESLKRREKAVIEAEQFQVRSIAAKQIDKAWRSHNMVPACPHCSNGLFPEDFKREPSMMDKDYARARLGKKR
jgi:Zn finger protein HypA/HybF involved in hydrogenase expression